MIQIYKYFYCITKSYFRDFYDGSDSQLEILVSKWYKQGGLVGTQDSRSLPTLKTFSEPVSVSLYIYSFWDRYP